LEKVRENRTAKAKYGGKKYGKKMYGEKKYEEIEIK
jgi:hypothetical protein